MLGLPAREPAVSGGGPPHDENKFSCAVLNSSKSGGMLPGQPGHPVPRSTLHWEGTENRMPPKMIGLHPGGTEVTDLLSTTERGE